MNSVHPLDKDQKDPEAFELPELMTLRRTITVGLILNRTKDYKGDTRLFGNAALTKAIERLTMDIGIDGLRYEIKREGRPHLVPDHQIRISLSHTSGIICATASLVEVGVDCEQIREFSPSLQRKMTDPHELRRLGPVGDRLLTRIWCAKEAASKAVGLGLKLDFHRVQLFLGPRAADGRVDRTEQWYSSIDGRDDKFTIKLIEHDAYIIALAEKEPNDNI